MARKNDDWLTPRAAGARTHGWRRRNQIEQQREAAMRDWYGDALGELEIEAHQQAPTVVGESIEAFVSAYQGDDRVLMRLTVDAWPELATAAAGDGAAAASTPRSLRGDTLLVEVIQSAWLYELNRFPVRRHLEQQIVALSGGRIRAIRFVAGGATAGATR